jgi:guanine deaminase
MSNSADEAAQQACWMDEAISLARAGMRIHGGGPFGAVIVADGELVGRGCNQVTPLLDPTAHAEIVAIRDACRALQRFDLRGCILYTSCEPCPMCLAAIYWARLDRVYFASTRKDAAGIGFDDDFIYEQIPLDLSVRSLPMVQLPTSAAADLFSEWSAKPDKIPY